MAEPGLHPRPAVQGVVIDLSQSVFLSAEHRASATSNSIR